MTRWSHPRQQIRQALDEAYRARNSDGKVRFEVNDTNRHGHGWGHILCLTCKQRFSIWSTPRNADNHADQIRRFMRRHHH